MNSTIVLNRLVAARNEGGSAHAVTAAQGLVAQYYPGREFDAQAVVTTVLGAVDRFDRAAAETAINDALATLARPEPVRAGAATPVQAGDHEVRITALETIARQNGITLPTPAGVGTHEQRITALETAARNRGLL